MDDNNIKISDSNNHSNNSNIIKLENTSIQDSFRANDAEQLREQNIKEEGERGFQNPHKLQKTDENWSGVPPFADTNNQNYSTNMHPYKEQNFNVPYSQGSFHTVNQMQCSQQLGDAHKHVTENDQQKDVNTMNQLSYAQGMHDNANYDEHKENNDSDDAFSDDPKSRTSASSRVNFSKLTAEEKERRCHNMSKEVKQLRRKIRNMEERLARSNTSVDYKTSDGLGESQNWECLKKGISIKQTLNDNLVLKAKEKIKSYKGYELTDQADLLENLWSLVAQDKLKTDSLAFYMIWTLVRAHLTPEELKRYENDEDQQEINQKNDEFQNKEILISLPEKEVRISKKEFQFFAPYQENEQIMRLLTGQMKEDTNITPQIGNAPSQNEQMELINRVIQGGQNLSGFNYLPNMQNLLNPQMFGQLQGLPNMGQINPSDYQNKIEGGNQNMNPLLGLNQNLLTQMTQPQYQNPYSSQMLNNLVSASMQNSNWGMNSMQSMPQNFSGMPNQSLNELIQTQMMNYNINPYMSQDHSIGNPQTQNGNNQN